MKQNELVENLTEDIWAYVMQGGFPKEELSKHIKPDTLDDRFEEYERLLDLHFLLREDVVDFVEDLEKHLRSIKTQTRTVSKTRHGTIDGRINWSQTYQKRYSTNPRDSTLFVCDNRSENYNIPENIVLKKLLSVIYNALEDADKYLREDYNWVTERWQENRELIDRMKEIFERNVHVRRIDDPEEYEPTDRMTQTAEQSRQEIYREAANLLNIRRKIQEGDEDELKKLLNMTAITPDDRARLFELYVLFRYMDGIREVMEGDTTIKTIARNRQKIAQIVGEDTEVALYHDSTVKDPELSFLYDYEGDDSRPAVVQKKAREVFKNYFDENRENRTGRPDVIVIEVVDKKTDEYHYLITEVKDSKNRETIRQGMKETLEYLAFAKLDDRWVFKDGDEEGIFGDGTNGVLVIQDLEEDAGFENETDEPIRILQANELTDQERVKEIIEPLFS